MMQFFFKSRLFQKLKEVWEKIEHGNIKVAYESLAGSVKNIDGCYLWHSALQLTKLKFKEIMQACNTALGTEILILPSVDK